MIEENNTISLLKSNPSEAHQHTRKSTPMKDRESKSDSAAMQQDFDELNPPPFDDEYNRQYLNEGFIEPESEIALPILAKTKTKQLKKAKNPGLPLYQIQFDLVDWMSGGQLVDAKPFEEKFVCYYSDKKKNSIEIARLTDRFKAVPSSDKELLEYLTSAMKKFYGAALQYCLPFRARKETVEAYIAEKHSYRLAEPPATFCWESEDKIAFNRVKDPIFVGEYGSDSLRDKAPIYCDWIDRCGNMKDQVRQFFGSYLFTQSSHKQVLHLWGGMDAGKTTMVQIILECLFGIDGFETIDVADFENDKYLFDDFVGKMAIMADEIDAHFYKSNAFKRYTGGIKHRVQVKHKPSYSTSITAKMIATSNRCPALPNDKAVLGRVIVVHVDSLKPENKIIDRQEFKKRFLAEVPYLLADVKLAFEQLKGKRIEMPLESYQESVEIGMAAEQVFFDQYFRFKPTAKTLPVAEFKRIVIQQGPKDRNFYQKMRDFVMDRYESSFQEMGGTKDARFKAVSNIEPLPSSIQGLVL